MDFFSNLRISSSGLSAERMRMDAIASNIANQDTTRTEEGGPYIRKVVTFEENLKSALNKNSSNYADNLNGVRVSQISDDKSALKKVYDPSNPDADANGIVTEPNINVLNELVDLMSSSRAYEANVTAFNAGKGIEMKALEIGK